MNYFDCHADTLTEISTEETLWRNHINLDLNRIGQFADRYIQVFALWRDRGRMQRLHPEQEFLRLYDRALSLLAAQRDKIRLCRNGEELQQALSEGKAAAFLAVEDASIMGSCVDQIKELGISVAMLTWNYENEYAAGAVSCQKQGLTQEGRRLVGRLLEQNIILDISHLSDAGADEIFSLTRRPVIASHSNVRAQCNHPRNLPSSHIQEIIRRGGMIGMNLYAPFVAETESVALTDLFRHIDDILDKGGEDALALGTDFDGCSNHFPQGITGVESMPHLWDELKNAGFEERILKKLFFENGFRFFRNYIESCV